MSEKSTPQWLLCGECGHEWVGFHIPIDVRKLNKVLKNTHCPLCAADHKKIYMTMRGLDE